MTFNSFSIKNTNSDLIGKSGRIYSFSTYKFNSSLSSDAEGVKSIIYIAKVHDLGSFYQLYDKTNLSIVDDISKFHLNEKYINTDLVYCIYQHPEDGDLESVFEDISDAFSK